MKSIFETFFSLLLFIPFTYAQKSQIKAAQKELKAGNSEQVIAILSPVEYLIKNASNEDKIHFYYIKGTALVDLANQNNNVSKNLSEAVYAFNDLIDVENESNQYKYSSEAFESLNKIKKEFVDSANSDLGSNNFAESSKKFHQAYSINKKDTLQLYNAALSYRKANDNEMALKCYEELQAINYTGNVEVFIAYNKNKLKDEYFATLKERNIQIQNGTHFRPREEFQSKKVDIYKNIAMIYMETGYKEKAIKEISLARNLDGKDLSLAIIEAKLYLEIKDYDYFNNLVSVIIESNPNNAELVTNIGMICQNEQYNDGADYYYKKAIQMNPQYIAAYVNISSLLVEKSIKITNQMNELGSSIYDKKALSELKSQKEDVVNNVFTYLYKVVSVEPFNSSVKQLVSCMNTTNINNSSIRALASDE